MIITARRAHGIADPNFNKNVNLPKKQVRQLRKIESAIMRASKKGKMFIDYYSSMYNCVFETLEKNGYKVIDRSNYKYGTRYVISWKEPKWK